MTLRAITAACECFAPGDQSWCEAARSRQRHRSDGRPPRQRAKSCKPETSECNDRDEQFLVDEQLLEQDDLLKPCLRLAHAHESPIGDQRNDEREERTCDNIDPRQHAESVGMRMWRE